MYTTTMELGPQSHTKGGLFGPNFILVVYVDPLGHKPYPKAPKRVLGSLGEGFGFGG